MIIPNDPLIRLVSSNFIIWPKLVEIGRLAGQTGWNVFVEGNLDCDIPNCKHWQRALAYAARRYKNCTIRKN